LDCSWILIIAACPDLCLFFWIPTVFSKLSCLLILDPARTTILNKAAFGSTSPSLGAVHDIN